MEQRGELIYLQHPPETAPYAAIPAIVRPLTVEQLIGNITQQNFFLIISPTHINRSSDPRIPIINDRAIIRGVQRAIRRVAPVFDAGEGIRIELTVLG